MKKFRFAFYSLILFTIVGCGGSGSSSTGSGSAGGGLTFTVNGTRAMMSGTIGSGLAGELQSLRQSNPQVTTIVMVDVPGSVDDIAAIAAYPLIRQFGWSTEVPANGSIASGGVDFFVAGVSRRVIAGGSLGVHAWSDGTNSATDFPPSDPQHQLYINYYRSIGLSDPSGFYFFTINAAPASSIHNMTRAEIARFGLET